MFSSLRPRRRTSLPVTGRWDPSLDLSVLPGCAPCGGPHPMALRPVPLDTDHCPRCGAAVAPPRSGVAASVTGGLWIAFANWTHAAARGLVALATRLRSV